MKPYQNLICIALIIAAILFVPCVDAGTNIENWTLIQRLGSETYVSSLVDLGNGVALAGTGATGQVYRTTDYGGNWALIQRLGSETYVFSLVDLGNGVALAGTYPTGQVYRFSNAEIYIPPVASFMGSPIYNSAPLRVFFMDGSHNNPTAWYWDFGDGEYSNERNPTHIYSESGFYTVSLNASTKYASNISTKTNFVMVY